MDGFSYIFNVYNLNQASSIVGHKNPWLKLLGKITTMQFGHQYFNLGVSHLRVFLCCLGGAICLRNMNVTAGFKRASGLLRGAFCFCSKAAMMRKCRQECRRNWLYSKTFQFLSRVLTNVNVKMVTKHFCISVANGAVLRQWTTARWVTGGSCFWKRVIMSRLRQQSLRCCTLMYCKHRFLFTIFIYSHNSYSKISENTEAELFCFVGYWCMFQYSGHNHHVCSLHQLSVWSPRVF